MPVQFATYSFLDVALTLIGPGGALTIGGPGAGNTEEGVTIEMEEDKNTMSIGAGGDGMHSLHAGHAGFVTVRLLKTSTINQALAMMYDFQRLSSANWGQNYIILRNASMGDIVSAQGCAFRRWPTLGYSKDGPPNEWSFASLQIDGILGIGLTF